MKATCKIKIKVLPTLGNKRKVSTVQTFSKDVCHRVKNPKVEMSRNHSSPTCKKSLLYDDNLQQESTKLHRFHNKPGQVVVNTFPPPLLFRIFKDFKFKVRLFNCLRTKKHISSFTNFFQFPHTRRVLLWQPHL